MGHRLTRDIGSIGWLTYGGTIPENFDFCLDKTHSGVFEEIHTCHTEQTQSESESVGRLHRPVIYD